MPTTAQIIQYAPIAQYLAANYVNKRSKLFGGGLDPKLPINIYMVYSVLKEIYDRDPTYDGVDEVALLLWELMGRFGLAAQGVVGSGVVATPSSATTTPNRLDFIVDASSFMVTGATTATLPAAWEGFEVDFHRNGIPQSTIVTEASYFTWNKTTRALTCFPALSVGELIAIIPG